MNSKLKNEITIGKFILENLPQNNTRLFRIYVCAPYNGKRFLYKVVIFYYNFSYNMMNILDMYEETCELFTKVFPKLREFVIARYGVEFTVMKHCF